MRIFAVVAVVLAFGLGSSAWADKYSMKDLKALQKSKSWGELLAHGLDVAPSDRDEEWQEVIEAAAVGQLQEAKDEDMKYLSSMQARIDADVKTFTFLKTAKKYKRAASKAMIKTYKGCYQSRECKRGSDIDWLLSVKAYVEAEGTDPVTACDAGDMISTFMTPTASLHMYDLATPKGGDCCKSKSLKEAVKAGLKDAQYKEDAQKVAKRCKV